MSERASDLRVGDVCEIVKDLDGRFSALVGRECVITDPLEMRPSWPFAGPVVIRMTFLCKLQGDNFKICCAPEELRKKKPPTVEWEDCVWRPEEFTV